MSIFKPVELVRSNLNEFPIVPGQLIYCTDTLESFLDASDGLRVQISDTIYLETEADRDAMIVALVNKLYIVKETNKLYTYTHDNGWSPAAQGPQGVQGPQGLQGIQGEIGYAGQYLKIVKLYPTVADLLADTQPTGINNGECAIVSTVLPSDADNNKIYMWQDSVYIYMNLTEDGARIIEAVAGVKGDTGATGAAGATGAVGAQGIQGVQGPVGLTGATGAQGDKGDKGDTGAQGPTGSQGMTGATGLLWAGAYSNANAYVIDNAVSYLGASYFCIVASTGNLPTDTTYWNPLALQGISGPQGIQGVQGPVGLTGATGATGDTGAQGVQGAQGLIGLTGAQGVQGPIGATGTAGVQGPIGLTGATGAAGVSASTTNVVGSISVSSPLLISTAAQGTAPLTITSNTMVANLNAAQVGGSTLANINSYADNSAFVYSLIFAG